MILTIFNFFFNFSELLVCNSISESGNPTCDSWAPGDYGVDSSLWRTHRKKTYYIHPIMSRKSGTWIAIVCLVWYSLNLTSSSPFLIYRYDRLASRSFQSSQGRWVKVTLSYQPIISLNFLIINWFWSVQFYPNKSNSN